MVEIEILVIVLVLLALLGLKESLSHRSNLNKLPIRIHVNGTRGKSSVTRLIAGASREAGRITCAKTTGTLARMILPDGSEYPVFRPSGVSVIEQVRIVATAAAYKAQMLVIECMALQPYLQWISESQFVRATHSVITNARADHLDVMGPEEKDVALALAGMTPVRSKLYLGESRHRDIFEAAAADRGSELVCLSDREVAAVSDEEMAQFSYLEHKSNVALALRVCRDLDIDRETALRGMWKANPDPGVMIIYQIRFFGRRIYFANGFSANDPESTEHLWNLTIERCPDVEKRIALFNCRIDRPQRSERLGFRRAGRGQEDLQGRNHPFAPGLPA